MNNSERVLIAYLADETEKVALDQVAANLARRYGVRVTRSDVLRQAVAQLLAAQPVGATGRNGGDDGQATDE